MNHSDAYMRDSDAFAWYMEADPLLRSTVVSVMLLDRAPEWERLYRRADHATRLAPGFRHKVVQAPLRIANPRWVADPDFDLAFHVRHIAVPPPGTLEQVLAYACQTGMAGFDRDRPLWEFTVVDGLQDGRAALVMKMHHSLTDGIGGMSLAHYLFDTEPEPRSISVLPDAPEPERLTTLGLVRDALRHNASRVAGMTRDVVRNNPRATRRLLRHPRRSARDVVRIAQSVARTVQPVFSTLSPVMRERRLMWHYDAFAVPLDALRDAAHAHDLTLNDVFLGAVSGGLQRYHDRHACQIDELRVTMPVSIRMPDDPIGGNRITLLRFKLPAGLRDPVERMRRIDEVCLGVRQERSLPYTNAIAAGLNMLPRGFVGGMLKHVDFLASNVPGISTPIYLSGAQVLQWYAFGPTIGAALNATLVSYDDTCYIGVNIDTGAIPDGPSMIDCLREGFAEIAGLATRVAASPGG